MKRYRFRSVEFLESFLENLQEIIRYVASQYYSVHTSDNDVFLYPYQILLSFRAARDCALPVLQDVSQFVNFKSFRHFAVIHSFTCDNHHYILFLFYIYFVYLSFRTLRTLSAVNIVCASGLP